MSPSEMSSSFRYFQFTLQWIVRDSFSLTIFSIGSAGFLNSFTFLHFARFPLLSACRRECGQGLLPVPSAHFSHLCETFSSFGCAHPGASRAMLLIQLFFVSIILFLFSMKVLPKHGVQRVVRTNPLSQFPEV